jgi:hypothetical protein
MNSAIISILTLQPLILTIHTDQFNFCVHFNLEICITYNWNS